MRALKVIIDFEYQVIRWDDVSIPMNRTKLAKNKKEELYAIFQLATEPKTVQQAAERVSCILDASYEKANLVEVVDKHCCKLSKDRWISDSLFYCSNLRIYLMVSWGSFTKTQYI